MLAFIPGARKDPQVRDRCFKSREKVCESYHKQRQKLCMHLLAHSCLLGRSFLRERGCCRLLRIYARWKAFLFLWKGSPRFRKSATDKILERVFMFARRECTDTALLLSRASGVFSLTGRYSFIRASWKRLFGCTSMRSDYLGCVGNMFFNLNAGDYVS